MRSIAWKQASRTFGRNRAILLLSLPGVLFLLVFAYLPMVGVVLAFKDYYPIKGIWASEWIGFKNFAFFFQSQDAYRVTRNTIGINLLFIATTLFISVSFALMLNELRNKAKVYLVLMFIPFFVSWVVASYILYAFLNTDLGVLNHLLTGFGLQPVQWYAHPRYWVAILAICHIWKATGYATIIYYTGLIGIDQTYYEAAAIDGASKWRQMTRISIPLLVPLMTLLVLVQVGHVIRSDFGMFYFLTKDSTALYPVTDVIDTYVFRALRVTGDIGMATAAGLYQSAVGFVLVLVTNAVVKKINRDNAVF
ncbi:MAG: sugar ABC transporter permease [Paenibacillaceae bacterium]|uniref:ABC transporter permease n=1 Tax=Paenibacillus cymbidii TaxID=1639034 RepID=UPI001081F264|nr:ABC transporter permease subunit [Paenibacillus cymbidii]MBO9610828.1 sugar ABC transporter permease [Paenibacillaceae bacterium]